MYGAVLEIKEHTIYKTEMCNQSHLFIQEEISTSQSLIWNVRKEAFTIPGSKLRMKDLQNKGSYLALCQLKRILQKPLKS